MKKGIKEAAGAVKKGVERARTPCRPWRRAKRGGTEGADKVKGATDRAADKVNMPSRSRPSAGAGAVHVGGGGTPQYAPSQPHGHPRHGTCGHRGACPGRRTGRGGVPPEMSRANAPPASGARQDDTICLPPSRLCHTPALITHSTLRRHKRWRPAGERTMHDQRSLV
jgi:hypothetical protein